VKPEGPLARYQEPALFHFLNQMNYIRFSFEIHFNHIFSSTPWGPLQVFRLEILCISHISIHATLLVYLISGMAQLAPLSTAEGYNFVCQKYCDVRGSTFKFPNISNVSLLDFVCIFWLYKEV
jgi:hypothetical protein